MTIFSNPVVRYAQWRVFRRVFNPVWGKFILVRFEPRDNPSLRIKNAHSNDIQITVRSIKISERTAFLSTKKERRKNIIKRGTVFLDSKEIPKRKSFDLARLYAWSQTGAGAYDMLRNQSYSLIVYNRNISWQKNAKRWLLKNKISILEKEKK